MKFEVRVHIYARAGGVRVRHYRTTVDTEDEAKAIVAQRALEHPNKRIEWSIRPLKDK